MSGIERFYAIDHGNKVRLRGEVHRLVAPRDQKHQSNFVEVRGRNDVARIFSLSHTISHSSRITRSCTDDTPVSSSAYAWTLMTMSWRT